MLPNMSLHPSTQAKEPDIQEKEPGTQTKESEIAALKIADDGSIDRSTIRSE